MYDEDADPEVQEALRKSRAWVSDAEIAALTMERKSFTDESPLQQATRIVAENAPMAAMTLVRLAMHSESDTVRLRAATEILNRASESGTSGRAPWEDVFDKVTSDVETSAQAKRGG